MLKKWTFVIFLMGLLYIYRLCLCCFNWSACLKSWPSKSSCLGRPGKNIPGRFSRQFQTDQHLQWDQTWHSTLHHQYIGVPTYLSYNISLQNLICVPAIGYIKWYWCYCDSNIYIYIIIYIIYIYTWDSYNLTYYM